MKMETGWGVGDGGGLGGQEWRGEGEGSREEGEGKEGFYTGETQHRILNERIKCDSYSLVFNQVILTSSTCFVRMLMMTVSPTLTPPADQGDRLLHLTSKRVRRTSHDAVQHCRLY